MSVTKETNCGVDWRGKFHPGFGIVSPDLTGMTEHDLIRTSIFVLYPGDLGTILFFTAWVFQVYLAAVFNVVMQYSSPPPSLLCGEEYCVTTLKTAAR